jgi:hypothetical protein
VGRKLTRYGPALDSEWHFTDTKTIPLPEGFGKVTKPFVGGEVNFFRAKNNGIKYKIFRYKSCRGQYYNGKTRSN